MLELGGSGSELLLLDCSDELEGSSELLEGSELLLEGSELLDGSDELDGSELLLEDGGSDELDGSELGSDELPGSGSSDDEEEDEDDVGGLAAPCGVVAPSGYSGTRCGRHLST